MEPAVILITGATGFVGTALRRFLADRFPSAELRGVSRSGGQGVVAADINDGGTLDSLFVDVDVVFHLAAFSRVPELLDEPAAGFATNVTGTANLLELARRHSVGRFVMVSTGRVLGSPAVLPATEDLPLAPAEPYSAQKAAGELMTAAWQEAYGLPSVIVRPPIVYGPGQVMKPGSMSGVIPRFVHAVLHGEPVTLMGDGAQRSDFIYIDDAVRGLVAAGVHPDAPGQTFHLGSGVGSTIADVLKLVVGAVGKQAEITRLPAAAETIDSFLSGMKAREVLGFERQMTLEEGLKRYVQWLRNQ